MSGSRHCGTALGRHPAGGRMVRRRSGTSAALLVAHRSIRSGQRERKAQPCRDRARRRARCPGSGKAGAGRPSGARNRLQQASRVGMARPVEDRAHVAVLDHAAAYMTITRSQMSAMTPRSCEISRIAVSSCCAQLASSARAPAPGWSRRAPSSARRRSAACGLQASAMAIITRWRMPPENWCG